MPDRVQFAVCIWISNGGRRLLAGNSLCQNIAWTALLSLFYKWKMEKTKAARRGIRVYGVLFI